MAERRRPRRGCVIALCCLVALVVLVPVGIQYVANAIFNPEPPREQAADRARSRAYLEQSDLVDLLESQPNLEGLERLSGVRDFFVSSNRSTGEMRAPSTTDDGKAHFWMFYTGLEVRGAGITENAAWSLLCVEFVLDLEGPTDVLLRDADCEGPALEVDEDYVEVDLE